jgi:hypothetical protein
LFVHAGPSQEAEGESKRNREGDKGPYRHHREDAKYLEEEDIKYDRTRIHCTIHIMISQG